MPTETRFWEKVDRRTDDDCWLWTAGVDQRGYGKFWDGTYRDTGRPRMVRAHQWAYRHFVGPTDGLSVMHRCGTPGCVNFLHCLVLGTKADNNRDRARVTEEQVIEMRRLYAAGGVVERELAAQFGISRQNVNAILARRTWQHV